VIDESALDVSGSGSNTVVIVETHNHSGNAVVKIYKAGDETKTPVWSYHIWVTDPDAIVPWENTNQPGYIFMDRNLGATEAANSLAGRGLFYQWGRKDPFPGGKSGTAGYAKLSSFEGLGTTKKVTDPAYAGSSSTTAAQINASIQHPTVFFSAVSSGDWLSARENALWNVTRGSQRIKSIYDPCPSSWRVPEHVGNKGSETNSPWKDLTTKKYSPGDTGGATFSASGKETLYPAAGNRSGSGGSFDFGGANGYYWSASVNGNYGYDLDFYSNGTIAVAGYYSRAYGFSVRCVRE
jgi:hypothetical protein